MMKKVIGIGNALVDILSMTETDEVLCALGYPKGSMQLIDEEAMRKIERAVSPMEKRTVAGGSAANTINGIAKLGAEAAFIGKVGQDDVGELFRRDIAANGVKPLLLQGARPSGRCNVLVSKDGERTMFTYLGAADELCANDLTVEMFRGYDILHIEGYLVQNYGLIEAAGRMAKAAGLTVSLDMASFNIVEENRPFLREFVGKYVDIVFANEEEAFAFTGRRGEDAAEEIAAKSDIAVVKMGGRGSVVRSREEVWRVGPNPVRCVDTTGAGDLYAAGFLYGVAHGVTLEECALIGSACAEAVIQTVGARLPDNEWARIKSMLSA